MERKKLGLGLAVAVLVLGAGAAKVYAVVSIASTNVPLAIPDNGSTASTLNFTAGGAATITDANVQFSITHTWDSDIVVSLAHPSGTLTRTVMQNCGTSGDNFNVVIDDAGAAGGCAFANTPITGTIQARTGAAALAPTQMASFNGVTAVGAWTLTAGDDSAICTGTLNSWSLTLDGAPPLPVELMNFDVD